jgi:hypothetical protein
MKQKSMALKGLMTKLGFFTKQLLLITINRENNQQIKNLSAMIYYPNSTVTNIFRG